MYHNRLCTRKISQSQNYAKLPVALLGMKRSGKLSANDIAVCAYIMSLSTASAAVNGFKGVMVSRERISIICGLTVRTVGNIIKKLFEMGLLNVHQDEWRGKRRSNIYAPAEPLLDLSGGFFIVPRRIFKKGLASKQLLVYFFLCHARNNEYGRSWNSYNDIADRLSMNRREVVKLIRALERGGYITKSRRKISERGKGTYYTDNRYSVVWLVFAETANKKKSGRNYRSFSSFSTQTNISKKRHLDPVDTNLAKLQ